MFVLGLNFQVIAGSLGRIFDTIFHFAQGVLDFSFYWFDGAPGLSFAIASNFTGLARGRERGFLLPFLPRAILIHDFLRSNAVGPTVLGRQATGLLRWITRSRTAMMATTSRMGMKPPSVWELIIPNHHIPNNQRIRSNTAMVQSIDLALGIGESLTPWAD